MIGVWVSVGLRLRVGVMAAVTAEAAVRGRLTVDAAAGC